MWRIHRKLVIAVAVILSGCGCGKYPRNAAPSDVKVLESIKPSLENASWNADGRIISLDLAGESIDDNAAINLSRLDELIELKLHGTSITKAGLVQLSSLTKLEALAITDTCIDDGNVATLLNLRRLVVLDLARTCVTDEGVLQLAKLPRLKHLFVRGNKISSQVVNEFRRVNPNCKVQID